MAARPHRPYPFDSPNPPLSLSPGSGPSPLPGLPSRLLRPRHTGSRVLGGNAKRAVTPGRPLRVSRLRGAGARAPAKLLDLDEPAGLFEVGLELLGLVAVDALLDGLGSLVDERLRLLEAQAGGRAGGL